MHMLSCCQTTLPLYMASTICTLINLICAIPLYLRFGLGLRIKIFGLLLPRFQETRTMMQMQNHTKKQTELEWMLDPKIFMKIISKFKFQPEVDLFASRLNAQLTMLVSYHPDPEAMHVNAFSISWQGRPFYTFPPFAAIGKVLHKIVLDVATGIIAVPNWPKHPWYSILMKLLIDIPILLRSSKTLLQHPTKSTPHPLANKLNLLTCIISGKNQEQQTFQQRALGSSSRVGVPRQPKDMTTTLGNGKCFVVKGVLIPFQHL